jgi:hypothetical protein
MENWTFIELLNWLNRGLRATTEAPACPHGVLLAAAEEALEGGSKRHEGRPLIEEGTFCSFAREFSPIICSDTIYVITGLNTSRH